MNNGLNPSIPVEAAKGLPNHEVRAMKRILLLIRENGQQDIADLHPDEASARRALATYVRKRTGADVLRHAENDDEAIEAYFAAGAAVYTIVGVAGGGH